LSQPLILFADDDRDTLEAYEVLFRARGMAVHSVTDGAAALAKALELRPALLVLDLTLPRLHGLDVLRRLRADAGGARIPAVVLTGHTFPHDLEAARRCGADAVLTKPCDPEELCRTAALLLDGGDGPPLPARPGSARPASARSPKPPRV
jgi:hypothetical protein